MLSGGFGENEFEVDEAIRTMDAAAFRLFVGFLAKHERPNQALLHGECPSRCLSLASKMCVVKENSVE
jgi:hypothetical protein